MERRLLCWVPDAALGGVLGSFLFVLLWAAVHSCRFFSGQPPCTSPISYSDFLLDVQRKCLDIISQKRKKIRLAFLTPTFLIRVDITICQQGSWAGFVLIIAQVRSGFRNCGSGSESFFRPEDGKEDLGPHAYTIRNSSYSFHERVHGDLSVSIRLAFPYECGSAYGGRQQQIDTLLIYICLLYTSPSPRDKRQSRMPSSA